MLKLPVWKARFLFNKGVTIHLLSSTDEEQGLIGGLDWNNKCNHGLLTFDKLTTDYYKPTEIIGYFINDGTCKRSRITGKEAR